MNQKKLRKYSEYLSRRNIRTREGWEAGAYCAHDRGRCAGNLLCNRARRLLESEKDEHDESDPCEWLVDRLHHWQGELWTHKRGEKQAAGQRGSLGSWEHGNSTLVGRAASTHLQVVHE